MDLDTTKFIDSDDELIEDLFFFNSSDEEEDEKNKRIILNKDGTHRKVKRLNYSRSTKRMDHLKENPWLTHKYLKLISCESTNDPSSSEGKEFRRKFRLPYPLFVWLIKELKNTKDKLFCYPEKNVVNKLYNIPVELKVLVVLRILACGLTFEAASGFFVHFDNIFKHLVNFIHVIV